MQLSLWPGGAASNPQGTIEWAGGAIDWDSADIAQYGYDFAVVQSVSMACYGAKTAPGTNNAVSYTYDSAVGTNDTVVNGKNATVLTSIVATGTDMDAGESSSAGDTAATIPGQSASGNGNSGAISGDTSSGSSSGGSGGSGSSSSGSVSTASDTDCATDVTEFSQSCSGTSSSSSAAVKGESGLGGASAFAAMVAFVFLAWM